MNVNVVSEVEKVRKFGIFGKDEIEISPILRVITPEEEEAGYASMTAWMKERDRGCFRIMTAKDGDKRVTWCRRVMAEISAAKKMFADLISKGMMPYRVGLNGEASAEVMDEFDPTAEEVIFMPVRAIAGG